MTTDLAPGKLLLDRYRLDRRLDEGGMSVVWAGTQLSTGKAVALKLLKADAAKDEATKRRMLREARAACAVVHPNVVEIHDVLVLEDGSPVLVMDLLEGEPLRDRLVRRRSFPVDELATLMLPVISGVGTAHAAGVVHRDLKPDNIFLAREGNEIRVKVLDFGIAKVLATGNDVSQVNALTNTGTMLGTPYYMAPEQILGETIDHRADIWSLGVILYECLVGVRPTEAENVGKILKRVLTNEIEPLSHKAPHLPKDITALVDRMLSQSPKDRPATMREVGEALAPYAQGVTLGSFGPPNTGRGVDSGNAAGEPAATPPRAQTSREGADFAETLMAPRPGGLTPTSGEAAAARGGPDSGPEPKRRVPLFALGAGLALTAVAGLAIAASVTGYLGFAKGKERTPYVPANATVMPLSSEGCPPGMGLVPAGSFRMGSDDGKDDERPVHEMSVGALCVDFTEVTASAYRDCMQRGGCRQADSTVRWMDIPDSVRERESTLCTAYQTSQRELPMNCLSWDDADAYCKVQGKRLPTEVEWEYAAGGGPEHRRYPWGAAAPAASLLNVCDRSCAADMDRRGAGKVRPMFDEDDAEPQLAPVGKFPQGDSRSGMHDMAGNAWEWTSSPYCTYPEHGCTSQYRVFRGGGYGGTMPANVRVSARMWSHPAHRYNDVGFRCVKDAAR